MSSTLSTPSKSTTTSQQRESPIDLLSMGLLQEFTSLSELEVQLEQIMSSQQGLTDIIVNLNANYMQSEEIMEVQLMVRRLHRSFLMTKLSMLILDEETKPLQA